MAKCKACGAKIIWLQLKSGKIEPCDPQRIPYKSDPEGKLVLVTPEGKIARGNIDLDSDSFGYQSHFATCPAAGMFMFRRVRCGSRESDLVAPGGRGSKR